MALLSAPIAKATKRWLIARSGRRTKRASERSSAMRPSHCRNVVKISFRFVRERSVRPFAASRRLAPDARQPRLSVTRQSGRTIVVCEFDQARSRHVSLPRIPIMKRTITAMVPTFFIVAARVRGEQHTARFQSRTQFQQDTRQLLARNMKKCCVREDAVETVGRQIEFEEVLLPYF